MKLKTDIRIFHNETVPFEDLMDWGINTAHDAAVAHALVKALEWADGDYIEHQGFPSPSEIKERATQILRDEFGIEN